MTEEQSPFQLTVNGRHYNVQPDDIRTLDAIADGPMQWHVLVNNKRLQATCLSADYHSKQFVFKINGRRYTVSLADKYDRLITLMGLDQVQAPKIKDIRAPMPGLVLDILVQPGDALTTGDKVIILEAMKMENVIKAAGEGIVKSVAVEQGAAVEKGQVLVEFE